MPQEIITYTNESVVHLPRRSAKTTYALHELVRLDANCNATRKRGNEQALDDIPHITVQHRVKLLQGRVFFRVKLYDLDQDENPRILYYNELKVVHFDPRTWSTLTTHKKNQWIRNALHRSFTSLPHKNQPSEEHHQYFSLTDVAALSYDSCLRKFKLACKNNIEGVTGIKMTMTRPLAAKMGLDGDQAVEVQCGSSKTFSNVQTLAAGYEALAVNCSLVRPCQLGDISSNLLTLTPLMANNVDGQSKYSHNKYKRIKYVPLLHSSFEAVRIQFKSINGKDVQFASGAEETHISLHLTRRP